MSSEMGRKEGWGCVCLYVCIVTTYSKGKDQPGKSANFARGQLKREK